MIFFDLLKMNKSGSYNWLYSWPNPDLTLFFPSESGIWLAGLSSGKGGKAGVFQEAAQVVTCSSPSVMVMVTTVEFEVPFCHHQSSVPNTPALTSAWQPIQAGDHSLPLTRVFPRLSAKVFSCTPPHTPQSIFPLLCDAKFLFVTSHGLSLCLILYENPSVAPFW